jgi:spermidine/putrescine transport system permease protein
MLYNDITMVMGLVYTSMLFMVVPLISVLESLGRQSHRGGL